MEFRLHAYAGGLGIIGSINPMRNKARSSVTSF